MNDAQSIPGPEGEDFRGAAQVAGSGSANERQLVHAAVVADAHQVHAPGALLLQGTEVIACGAPEVVGAPSADTTLQERHHELILPPLVNAHVHLDLSDLPAPPMGGEFRPWLDGVRAHRVAQQEPDAVERAVEVGVEASHAGGCPFVGDICGSDRALAAVMTSGLGGVGFLEVLGHEERARTRATQLDADAARGRFGAAAGDGIVVGLSPHAPYSTARELYEAAARSGARVATHLAESQEELLWCEEGGGPFGRMLAAMDYAPGTPVHPGAHPIDAVLPWIAGERTLLVHLNYIEPRHLQRLAASGCTVAYCPRASRYFGHPTDRHPPHAWRAMLESGIPVALGTDGRPCLPGPGVRGRRLSVFDDARLLAEEDDARLQEWLPMATVHGARALGIDPDEVTFTSTRKRGILSVALADVDAALDAGARAFDVEAALTWIAFDEDAPAGAGELSA